MLDVDTEQAGRQPASASPRRPRPTIAALVLESLKLGLVGFGGGLAVLSSIELLLVVRRRWLTAREFGVTATVSQMLPGGAAANALAYTGLRFFGVRGAILAYAAFIGPGAAIVLLLAVAYVHLGVTPGLEPLLAGLNAAVVGIIFFHQVVSQLVRLVVVARPQVAVDAVFLQALAVVAEAVSPGAVLLALEVIEIRIRREQADGRLQ